MIMEGSSCSKVLSIIAEAWVMAKVSSKMKSLVPESGGRSQFLNKFSNPGMLADALFKFSA